MSIVFVFCTKISDSCISVSVNKKALLVCLFNSFSLFMVHVLFLYFAAGAAALMPSLELRRINNVHYDALQNFFFLFKFVIPREIPRGGLPYKKRRKF